VLDDQSQLKINVNTIDGERAACYSCIEGLARDSRLVAREWRCCSIADRNGKDLDL
jgi:hypothetical protein